MARLVLSAFCLLLLSGYVVQAAPVDTGQVVANSPDDEAESEAILEKVRAAIAKDDFTSLSAMEDDFRTSRARTPSGLWKLAVFHSGAQAYLAEGLERDSGCQYRKVQFVRRWASASPHNPGAFITDAALLWKQAWCIRGEGYASTVAADAWPEFAKGLAAAARTLERHRATASVDPEFYAVKINVLGGQAVGKSALQEVIEEAVAREPYYHRTYFNAAFFRLPQWGGSYAEVEEFARFAAERTRTSERSGFYARVFWSLEECGCNVTARAADWPTLRQAMRDVYDRYPVRWNARYFADLSCRMGDRDESRRYLRTMQPDATGKDMLPTVPTCDHDVSTAMQSAGTPPR